MTYLVSPEMELEIGGNKYVLSPSIECLKKIQHALKMDILDVIDFDTEKRGVKFDDYARIIHIAIDDYGTKPPELAAIEKWIVDDVGITNVRNILQGWLLVVTTPKKEREAIQRTVGEFLKAKGLKDFLGGSIRSSASATSDGVPETSGDPTSGK
jgi:hypothetical protein